MDDAGNAYNVFIDTVHKKVLFTGSGGTYELAKGLPAGKHILRLVKRTESSGTIVTLKGFVLDDGASLSDLPPRLDRRIEFFGDSYSAGLNCEATAGACNDMQFTNSSKAFPAVTAGLLGADYRVVAKSGIGLVRFYGSAPDPSNALGAYVDRTFPGGADKYNFTKWKPHVVVITIGMNDFTTQPEASESAYKGALKDMIRKFRSVYPGVKIIAFGERFGKQQTYSQAVVAEENAAGSKDVWYTYFGNWPNLYVCEHPNVQCHKQIASILANKVKEIAAWNSTDVRPAAFRTARRTVGRDKVRGEVFLQLNGRTSAAARERKGTKRKSNQREMTNHK